MKRPDPKRCLKSGDGLHEVDPKAVYLDSDSADEGSWPVTFKCVHCGRAGDTFLGPEEVWDAVLARTALSSLSWDAVIYEPVGEPPPRPPTKAQERALRALTKQLRPLVGKR
jgi:hypothetical protein